MYYMGTSIYMYVCTIMYYIYTILYYIYRYYNILYNVYIYMYYIWGMKLCGIKDHIYVGGGVYNLWWWH